MFMEPILKNAVADMPRTDYPRPQWKRAEWFCLNGEWDFAFDFGNSGEARGMVTAGDYPLTIQVPFCPESPLSGIGYTDFIPAVWYRRRITLDAAPEGRVLLHFGAVDHACKVWVNGRLCGQHRGGYTPFTVDVTAALTAGENVLVVAAQDDLRSGHQAIGKQSNVYHSHDCSYTRTTGIWQTVWMELVPSRYLERAEITPRAADGAVDVRVFTRNAAAADRVRLVAYYDGRKVGAAEAHLAGNLASTRVSVDEVHLWNPGAAELYDLSVELVDGTTGETVDRVESYFALRDVALTNRALTINGKPVFMRLILDQGFNPQGIYTAPDDDFLRRDIELAMELGFNGARLHQRVFEERTLYWADKLGYIVWDEHADGIDGIDLSGPTTFEDYLPEWMELVRRDYSHPSVIGWCCFNETYHRMVLDTETHRLFYRIVKAMDPTRPVIDASGGMHYETDMFDVHDYEQDAERLASYLAPMLENDAVFHSPVDRYRGWAPYRPENYAGQPYWVSEYGGTLWNPELAKSDAGWGYGDTPRDEETFCKRYEDLTRVLLTHPRVCGFCYTQLTDVEQEQNGLYRYDRTRKLPDWVYDRIRAINLTKAAIE